MNDIPPILPPAKPSQRVRLAWAMVAAVVGVVFSLAVASYFLRVRHRAVQEAEVIDKDFSLSNSVSILLGEEESGNGLRHLDEERDGQTSIETMNGLRCRSLRLIQNRTTLYFYFRIEPSFKQSDARNVRID